MNDARVEGGAGCVECGLVTVHVLFVGEGMNSGLRFLV